MLLNYHYIVFLHSFLHSLIVLAKMVFIILIWPIKTLHDHYWNLHWNLNWFFFKSKTLNKSYPLSLYFSDVIWKFHVLSTHIYTLICFLPFTDKLIGLIPMYIFCLIYYHKHSSPYFMFWSKFHRRLDS